MFGHAELAVVGANIITMDPGCPRAQSIAVHSGRFLAVGTDQEVAHLVGPGTRVIDARGYTITPGFVDAHCHPLDAGRRRLLRVNLGPDSVHSIADVSNLLCRCAVEKTPGEWVVGFGYDEAKLPENRLLTRFELDAVSRDHPIFVEHSSGHIAMVNSRALELAHLDAVSADPVGGSYGRDDAGALDGRVYETGQDVFIGRGQYRGCGLIPEPTAEEDYAAIELACRDAASVGITGWHEMLTDPGMLRSYQIARRRGTLTARVVVYIYVDYLSEMVASGVLSGLGDDFLRVGGIKMLGDGALSGRTAYLEEPYEGTNDDYGVMGVSRDKMEAQILEAHRAGFQIGIHANGDRFIAMVLDAYEKALVVAPRIDHRHRIEHCSVMNHGLLKRMKRLGLVAVPFGEYIYYHGEKMGSYGQKRLETMLPHRAFLDAGMAVAGSSDYPCGPWNPLLAIQSCVTRKTRRGEVIGSAQRISAEEAIGIYTLGSAFASFDDAGRGAIKVGKLADFVFLSDDPTTVDPESIGALQVNKTVVNGTVVYEGA